MIHQKGRKSKYGQQDTVTNAIALLASDHPKNYSIAGTTARLQCFPACFPRGESRWQVVITDVLGENLATATVAALFLARRQQGN